MRPTRRKERADVAGGERVELRERRQAVQMIGEEGNLLKAAWPKYDAALAALDEIEIPVQVNGKLRSRIIVLAGSSEDLIREGALADEKVKTAIAGKQIVKVIVVPSKLVNIVVR